jgi:hypothetical protein
MARQYARKFGVQLDAADSHGEGGGEGGEGLGPGQRKMAKLVGSRAQRLKGVASMAVPGTLNSENPSMANVEATAAAGFSAVPIDRNGGSQMDIMLGEEGGVDGMSVSVEEVSLSVQAQAGGLGGGTNSKLHAQKKVKTGEVPRRKPL